MAHPGLLFLYRTVFLDNGCLHPKELSAFVFNAVFFCSHPTVMCPQGVGSFQQYLENTNVNTMPHGLFSLSAKVYVHYCTFSAFSLLQQIVNFQTGRNSSSLIYDDRNVHLLGEIDTVCSIYPPLLLYKPFTTKTDDSSSY